MTAVLSDTAIAARFSADKALKLESEASEVRTLTEQFAASLAESAKADGAMRETRAIVRVLLERWLAELPHELAALEGQDVIHARLSEIAREGLAFISGQLAERAEALKAEAGSDVDPLIAHAGAAYCERAARASAPRKRLAVSNWADENRQLSTKQSGEPGQWRTDRNPPLREIMDCFSLHSDVRRIVVMKPSQMGVTEVCLNVIGYVMHHAPAPIMVLLPTIDNRDKWVTQKLTPLLTETPVLAELFDARSQRDATNSKDTKDFPGGVLFLAGGNSPNSYAQVSARYVILDDFDRFPAEVGAEGHPGKLARGRAKGFSRYKLAFISTPTIKEASHIEEEYEKSDQRRYHVPCPHCGTLQPLTWKQLKWQVINGQVKSVWYVCGGTETEPGCGAIIDEHHKPDMLAKGRWIARHPERRTRGYHINGLYAPIGLGKTWLELAQEWIEAQGDPRALKVFINTELAETFEQRGKQVKPKELAERRGPYKAREIPLGCLLLVCGVDTQDDRLEGHVLGIGPAPGPAGPGGKVNLIIWTIDYLIIPGDPSKDAVWDTLAQTLNRPYVNARGREMIIEATAIDEGGHHTHDVRFFAASNRARRLMAVKGLNRPSRSLMPNKPKPTEINRRGKMDPRGGLTWDVGTDVAKDYLHSRLVGDAELPKEQHRVRFHAELEDSFFEQMLAETFDPEKNRWIKKSGRRNEAGDTWNYGWFAAHHPQIAVERKTAKEWAALAALLEPELREDGTPPPLPEPKSKTKPAAPAGRQRQTDSSPDTGSWL